MTESTYRAPWELSKINDYEKIERIGEGTYGEVFRARHYETSEVVAVKKVKMPETMREGFPITAIREIKILKALEHTNIVKLKEIAISAQEELEFKSIFLIFEFLEHDLQGLLVQLHEKKRWLSLGQIKSIAKQLLEAVNYLHKNNVLHRDIKASNMLINNKGEVKLADFGLARIFQGPQGNYTNRVITLWFRPPELLLGAQSYGPEVDVWSVGCIIAELLFKRAILPGRTELDQLDLIFKLCGTPNEDNWPGVQTLPYWNTLKPLVHRASNLRQTFGYFDSEALHLIESMLKLNPKERITAEQALQSSWFASDPQPENLTELLSTLESLHEYTAKTRRQAKRESASSFSNSLNAKLQSMTLQPSPNKSVPTLHVSFTASNTEHKTSPTVPTINIQSSSPGNFSPKARTPGKRSSRSPSPSSINASLQNSFKVTSNLPPSSNPLPPIASQGYFSALQPQYQLPQQQQQRDIVSQNIPAYFAQHAQQPRVQSQFVPLQNTQPNLQFNQVQPQLTQMPQSTAQPLPQFSFPSAVPVMFNNNKPQSYQSAQPSQYAQPYSVQQHNDLQQHYMNILQAQYQNNYQQYYQQAYQDINQQLYHGGVYAQQQQPMQHAPHQYVAAEQAIQHDLARGTSGNQNFANQPATNVAPQFSFPSGAKPSLFTAQHTSPTFSPVSPSYSPTSPAYSPTNGSESDSAPLDDSDDADYVPSKYKKDKEPSKGARSLRSATKVP